MKECFKCRRDLPLSEFYKHKSMADGHLNKCKDCARADQRARYLVTEESRKMYLREYGQRPEVRRMRVERTRKHRALNPEKAVARNAVRNALRSGQLVRRPCEVCGAPKSEAHHDDYSRPLFVRWLCLRHHRAHHGMLLETA